MEALLVEIANVEKLVVGGDGFRCVRVTWREVCPECSIFIFGRETLKLKKSLFAGVFDSPTGEVSFAALGRKSILQVVKEIFADQPRNGPKILHGVLKVFWAVFFETVKPLILRV